MEIIEEEDVKAVEELPPLKRKNSNALEELTESKFAELMDSMETPIKAQKQIAVQIKNFLDQRIAEELGSTGILSDHTRRWVKVFNEILDKIQKGLYGDKSINLHIHKISHSDIARRIREASEDDSFS